MNSSGGRGRDDDEEGRAAAKAQLGSADGDGSRKGVRCGSTLAAAVTRRADHVKESRILPAAKANGRLWIAFPNLELDNELTRR